MNAIDMTALSRVDFCPYSLQIEDLIENDEKLNPKDIPVTCFSLEAKWVKNAMKHLIKYNDILNRIEPVPARAFPGAGRGGTGGLAAFGSQTRHGGT